MHAGILCDETGNLSFRTLSSVVPGTCKCHVPDPSTLNKMCVRHTVQRQLAHPLMSPARDVPKVNGEVLSGG